VSGAFAHRGDLKNGGLIQIMAGPWNPGETSQDDKKGVHDMGFESILFLSMVVGSLVVFAAVLTYAERASKQAEQERASPPAPARQAYPDEVAAHKKAA
jgi:hypothetical protein